MKVNQYYPRLIDRELKRKLATSGAVLIEGPKWCGKTTSAKVIAKDVVEFQNTAQHSFFEANIDVNPNIILDRPKPLLIDEWQEFPGIWDSVRYYIDQHPGMGQFILTGSTVVDTKSIRHSGVGRIARLQMHSMSLFESGESSGEISLKALFDDGLNAFKPCRSPMSMTDLVHASCRGGWPDSLKVQSDSPEFACDIAENYLDQCCRFDISRLTQSEKDPFLTRAILQSYARNIATLANNQVLLDDLKNNFGNISEKTLQTYLSALQQLYLIEEVYAWSPNIRSATAIRNSNKRCFTDPSIAAASLKLSPDKLDKDMLSFGFIFENLCFRDLRAYAQSLRADCRFFRDRYGLEVDCVLILPDGRYALIEFKLGSRQIEEAAHNLNKVRELILEAKAKGKVSMAEPSLMIVLTGGEQAYTRPDGVLVLPLACLRD